MKLISVVISFLLFSSSAFAAQAGGAGGTVNAITVKETGYILIKLDAPHANPMECIRDDMIAIPNNHNSKKEILSLVLTAQAANKSVNFWVTGCYEYYGSSFPSAATATVYK